MLKILILVILTLVYLNCKNSSYTDNKAFAKVVSPQKEVYFRFVNIHKKIKNILSNNSFFLVYYTHIAHYKSSIRLFFKLIFPPL